MSWRSFLKKFKEISKKISHIGLYIVWHFHAQLCSKKFHFHHVSQYTHWFYTRSLFYLMLYRCAIVILQCAHCLTGVDAMMGEFCCDMVREIKSSLIELMEREFNCSICGDLLIEVIIMFRIWKQYLFLFCW